VVHQEEAPGTQVNLGLLDLLDHLEDLAVVTLTLVHPDPQVGPQVGPPVDLPVDLPVDRQVVVVEAIPAV